MTNPPVTEEAVERARERFRLATDAVEAAKGEVETARQALRTAHGEARIEPDLELWREAHDEFCLAAGYCFTRGSTDCPTRARIAGLQAAAPYIAALTKSPPVVSEELEAQKQLAADCFRDFVNAQALADSFAEALGEIREKASGSGYCAEQAVSEIDDIAREALAMSVKSEEA